MKFEFGQDPTTNDCGYRCLYYVLQPKEDYGTWLKSLYHPNPVRDGLPIGNIISHLREHRLRTVVDELNDKDLFIVHSFYWLPHCDHYLIYDKGVVYDSVSQKPETLSVHDFMNRAKCYSGLKIFS